ncbi:Toxic anion resistance protein (TelA) [compost metagenome]
MMAANADDSHIIKLHIDAGRVFLQLNLSAGLPEQSDFPFESPRERFKRKLTNLSTLYHSHQMSILQMRFAKASAIALLDRFTETVTVSVPTWRQYNLAMVTTEKMNPDMIAAANQATNVLIKELSAALEAPTKKDE